MGPAVGVLRRWIEQLPVPSQERVRRDECRHVTQGGSTQPVSPYGQSPPVVRQPQAPPTNLPPQEAILFNKIGERLMLAAIQPAGDGKKQQLEDRHVDHERELMSQLAKRSADHRKVGHYAQGRVFLISLPSVGSRRTR